MWKLKTLWHKRYYERKMRKEIGEFKSYPEIKIWRSSPRYFEKLTSKNSPVYGLFNNSVIIFKAFFSSGWATFSDVKYFTVDDQEETEKNQNQISDPTFCRIVVIMIKYIFVNDLIAKKNTFIWYICCCTLCWAFRIILKQMIQTF